MPSEIHQTAIVHPQAVVAKDVTIGAYSIIGPNVSIGENTWVGPHVVIEGHTTIGANNKIFQFASIGSAPQDLKFSGEPSTVVIGSNNIIREYVTIQPGTRGGLMTTKVGDKNLFMACSHVGHDCIVGSGNVFANSVGLAGHVEIMNFAVLGGMVGVHQFCRIGNYAMVSGGAKVGHDIPPYCIGQGDRCYLRGVNVLALRRAQLSDNQIRTVRRVYRALFLSLGSLEQKISELSEDLKSDPVIKVLIEFCLTTHRGVTTCRRKNGSSDVLPSA